MIKINPIDDWTLKNAKKPNRQWRLVTPGTYNENTPFNWVYDNAELTYDKIRILLNKLKGWDAISSGSGVSIYTNGQGVYGISGSLLPLRRSVDGNLPKKVLDGSGPWVIDNPILPKTFTEAEGYNLHPDNVGISRLDLPRLYFYNDPTDTDEHQLYYVKSYPYWDWRVNRLGPHVENNRVLETWSYENGKLTTNENFFNYVSDDIYRRKSIKVTDVDNLQIGSKDWLDWSKDLWTIEHVHNSYDSIAKFNIDNLGLPLYRWSIHQNHNFASTTYGITEEGRVRNYYYTGKGYTFTNFIDRVELGLYEDSEDVRYPEAVGKKLVSFLPYNYDVVPDASERLLFVDVPCMFPELPHQSGFNIGHSHESRRGRCLGYRYISTLPLRGEDQFYPLTWSNNGKSGNLNLTIVDPDAKLPTYLDGGNTFPKIIKPYCVNELGHWQANGYTDEDYCNRVKQYRVYEDPNQHVYTVNVEVPFYADRTQVGDALWLSDLKEQEERDYGLNLKWLKPPVPIRTTSGRSTVLTSTDTVVSSLSIYPRDWLVDADGVNSYFNLKFIPPTSSCRNNRIYISSGEPNRNDRDYRAGGSRNYLVVPYNEGKIVNGKVVGDVAILFGEIWDIEKSFRDDVYKLIGTRDEITYRAMGRFYKLKEGTLLNRCTHGTTGVDFWAITYEYNKRYISEIFDSPILLTMKEYMEWMKWIFPLRCEDNDGNYITHSAKYSRLYYHPYFVESRLLAYGDNTRFYWKGNRCPFLVNRQMYCRDSVAQVVGPVRVQMNQYGYWGTGEDTKYHGSLIRCNGPMVKFTAFDDETQANKYAQDNKAKLDQVYTEHPYLKVTVDDCERELYGRTFQVIPCLRDQSLYYRYRDDWYKLDGYNWNKTADITNIRETYDFVYKQVTS